MKRLAFVNSLHATTERQSALVACSLNLFAVFVDGLHEKMFVSSNNGKGAEELGRTGEKTCLRCPSAPLLPGNL